MEANLQVSFNLTKNVDDYESVKIQGGIAIPIEIENEDDYRQQFKQWLRVIQKEVVNETHKYYQAVQKIKFEKFEKHERDDLK